MKAIASLVAIAVLAVLAQAETPTSGGGFIPGIGFHGDGYDYPYSYHSSTLQEGYARGIGDVIRAEGEYNLATSAAAVNFSEARRRQIENQKLWTQTYFEIREYNRQQRDAEIKRERGSPEDWIRIAQAGKPKRLDNRDLDAVTGQIRWPILLTGDNFEQQRALLEKTFAARAYHGVLCAEDFLNALQVIDEMFTNLKDNIQSLPAQEYVEAKRFLRSLAYEARLPAG